MIKPAAKALMDKGVPVGTLVNDTGFAADLLKEGFTFVACATDTMLLAKASDAALASVKSALE